jgi:membrane-bound lytic murein transglycosylase B
MRLRPTPVTERSSDSQPLAERRRWLRAGLFLGPVLGLGGWLTALSTPAQANDPRRRRVATPGPAYAGHAATTAFVAEVTARRGLDAAWLKRAVGNARRTEAVRRLIMPPPPGTAKNWAAYRARFVDAQRITAGVAFWRNHEAWLAEAEARWGVPPEIVVAIVGVETFYGRFTGRFRVVDALATLSFDFPPGRRTAAPSSASSSRSSSSGASASSSTRACRWAVMPAPSGCRSSCRAASTASPSTWTATATSTCCASRPT